MEIPKSKVYIQTDAQNRITRCEGGYTTPDDITGWIEIDAGNGDKYNLCQSHYFDGGLTTPGGAYRYALVDGKPALRSAEDIAADGQNVAAPASIETRVDALEQDVDSIITGLEAMA